MNCPFCKSPPRMDWGYQCGTSPNAVQLRSTRCWEAEVSVLKERIKQLESAINRASNRFFADGSDRKVAAEMLTIMCEIDDEEPLNDTPPKCSEHPRNPFILSEN